MFGKLKNMFYNTSEELMEYMHNLYVYEQNEMSSFYFSLMNCTVGIVWSLKSVTKRFVIFLIFVV
jgi:hypothetical protein